jgi:hypothetical protein
MQTRSASVTDRFASAFNARDVERVLTCFTPDATYRDLFYGTFEGHDGCRRAAQSPSYTREALRAFRWPTARPSPRSTGSELSRPDRWSRSIRRSTAPAR